MEKASLHEQEFKISAGSLLCTALGQAGFLFKGGTLSIAIDPYLSNYVVEGAGGDANIFSRTFPPPLDVNQIKGLNALFITHDHADHCDPQTILPLVKNNPQMKIICPLPVFKRINALGVPAERMNIPRLGVISRVGDLSFAALPAAHYRLEIDPEQNTSTYLGYVIFINGVNLYHSGDTVLYPGMVARLRDLCHEFDLVCLPVNGRDYYREQMDITGNLDGAEALKLALDLKAKVLLPMHNDLFTVNHINPAVLADLADRIAPRQRIHWLQPGEKFMFIR